MAVVDTKLAERILAQVNEQEIISMACDVINIPSPTGEELEMGRYMRAAMEGMGLKVVWQEVEEGRANVVGRWGGPEVSGRGKSLMFNGHMDTSNSGREPFLTGIGYKPKAVVRDGVIYGLGIYNMKGALVCYLHAVKALQAAGVKLEGEVIVAAVAGEIEKSQWESFSGKEFRGYGVGTHYLVNHGVVPDMCILGEPTDLQLVLAHYGTLWVRLSTAGHYVHTGFTEGRLKENSIRRMHDVLGEVLEWIPQWEEKAAFGGRKGVVNLGCIHAGNPWRASRTPDRADLFLDVRVPPTMPLQEARREVESLVQRLRQQHPD
ncbi:MAG: M20/M25/M40 family metallo-hydrolase, partial [Acidobacteria bacterium]|nr:M20/M25/M40 family metallo-hydrolase [Acidobacteriota bacterium]